MNNTSDFSSSGRLADLIIAVELCWQMEQRSVIGFIVVICGSSSLHSMQNVLYAAALVPPASHAA